MCQCVQRPICGLELPAGQLQCSASSTVAAGVVAPQGTNPCPARPPWRGRRPRSRWRLHRGWEERRVEGSPAGGHAAGARAARRWGRGRAWVLPAHRAAMPLGSTGHACLAAAARLLHKFSCWLGLALLAAAANAAHSCSTPSLVRSSKPWTAAGGPLLMAVLLPANRPSPLADRANSSWLLATLQQCHDADQLWPAAAFCCYGR